MEDLDKGICMNSIIDEDCKLGVGRGQGPTAHLADVAWWYQLGATNWPQSDE